MRQTRLDPGNAQRTRLWSVIAGLALAVLAATWFFANHDLVSTTRWEGPGPEAERNPYLALERFSARMRRPLQRVRKAEPPPGGVLLLDRGRRRSVDARRATDLLDWVSRGNYLIVAAEAESVDDPLQERLGVTRGELPEADPKVPPQDARLPLSVRIPGVAPTLRLEWIPLAGGLAPGTPKPLWWAGTAENHYALLHYSWGKGFVTVVDDFDFLTNRRIGKYDHAELLWTLLRQYRPQGAMRLAAQLELPSLWSWLAESAWMTLLSVALSILVWLWSIVPRFGLPRPEPEPDRRGLREHLAAMGRAVWRKGGAGLWLDWVRRDFRARLAARYPHLEALPPEEWILSLARMGDLAPGRMAELWEGGNETTEDLLRLLRVLQRIEQEW